MIWLHFQSFKKPDSLPSKVALSQNETPIPTEQKHTITQVHTYTQRLGWHVTHTHGFVTTLCHLKSETSCFTRNTSLSPSIVKYHCTTRWHFIDIQTNTSSNSCYNVVWDIIKVSQLFTVCPLILLQIFFYKNEMTEQNMLYFGFNCIIQSCL